MVATLLIVGNINLFEETFYELDTNFFNLNITKFWSHNGFINRNIRQ